MKAENTVTSGVTATGLPQCTLVLTRLLSAPRQLVFDAWTQAEKLRVWWGPKEFTNPICEVDATPGGSLRIVMRGPDGTDYTMRGVFCEVESPSRLVFTNIPVDANDNPLVDGITTVTFEMEGDKTRLTVETSAVGLAPEAVRMFAGMEEGWSQSLVRLVEFVGAANGDEFVMIRSFDAPRDLVFRAWTERELLQKWWGPKGCSIRIAALDARPDGIFHYRMEFPDGSAMWGRWVIQEVTPPERLVFTSSFSDEEGNIIRPPFEDNWPLEIRSTVTFAETDGKTTMTMRGIAFNATDEERATFTTNFASMQGGWGGSLDELEATLAAL